MVTPSEFNNKLKAYGKAVQSDDTTEANRFMSILSDMYLTLYNSKFIYGVDKQKAIKEFPNRMLKL